MDDLAKKAPLVNASQQADIMNIRILHVMTSLERSGMEMMLLDSFGEWKTRGIQADILATAANTGPLAEELRTAGYSIFHIPFRSNLRYLPHARLIPDFFRLCKKGGYQIVHIHREAFALFVILARLAGIPTIVCSVHNTFHFQGALRTRKYAERRLTRALGAKYGMVSNAVMACEQDRFRNRGIRIYNWLNTERFRPPSGDERDAARSRLGCAKEAFVVCTVGNCDSAKNHSELIRALAELKAEYRIFLLHVGREQADQAERLLAADHGLTNRIQFVGSQPDPCLYLWAADAFVMPSLHEGLSIAALEGVAAGTPAVFTNVDGLDEIAIHAQGVVLCEPKAHSLADAIIKLIRMPPEHRLKCALQDSARIRSQFSAERGVSWLMRELYGLGDTQSVECANSLPAFSREPVSNRRSV